MKRNQKGFTAVETLLVLIILGLVGFAGWWVYQSKNKINKTLDGTAQGAGQAQKVTKSTPIVDPTKDWTAYTSEKGKFYLRYPNSWVQPDHKELCTPGLFDRALYLGPDKNSVLRCATEFFGQISVGSEKGTVLPAADLSSDYENIAVKDVTVNGVKGKRISGTAKKPAEDSNFAPLEGTTAVTYKFFVNGNVYTASYIQAPKGQVPSQDVLSDFELMVTKTLKFN